MIRIVMLLSVSLLSACGQKGPLFFPPENAKPYVAPESNAPSERFDAPKSTTQPAS